MAIQIPNNKNEIRTIYNRSNNSPYQRGQTNSIIDKAIYLPPNRRDKHIE